MTINKHLTGFLLGAVGGALGTLVMTAFMEQQPATICEEEVLGELEPVPLEEQRLFDEQPAKIPSDAQRLNLTSFGAAI